MYRIVKLEFSDGTVKYQAKMKNWRGGWDTASQNGQELMFDTFDDAYHIILPNEEYVPYILKETVLIEAKK